MIIDTEKVKESIGGDHCKGCPHFDVDVYEARGVIQIGCEHEELCAALYGRALDKAKEHYHFYSKLP